jgi:hypothetical protein
MAEALDRDTLFKKLRSKPENKARGGGHSAPAVAARRHR